jgi:hypothetical protein
MTTSSHDPWPNGSNNCALHQASTPQLQSTASAVNSIGIFLDGKTQHELLKTFAWRAEAQIRMAWDLGFPKNPRLYARTLTKLSTIRMAFGTLTSSSAGTMACSPFWSACNTDR